MGKSRLAILGSFTPGLGDDAMAIPHALAALNGLGQPTRLAIYRLLIRAEPDGLPAGEIATQLRCRHNTLSSHLSVLARSGLVHATRNGRSINYRASIGLMRTLVAFLVSDCCAGHPELCELQSKIAKKSGRTRTRKETWRS